MNLNDFTWDRTDEGTSIDLRITQMPDGSCQIENLKNDGEMYETDSPRHVAEAMTDLLAQTH